MPQPPVPILGILGGSGLYEMSDLVGAETIAVETPYGAPSDDLVIGKLNGTCVAFLPRHGKGHRYSPSDVPYLANLWALKHIGCQFVLSVSAVGSLREDIETGQVVVVDQFIDRTIVRPRSFFGNGLVGHVSFADPVCETLRKMVVESSVKSGATTVDGGTYICIEGPSFSTRAESRLYRDWGADVVGMTNLPEARLAREAGMSYATLALVTDYDSWHDVEEPVSLDLVLQILMNNVTVASEIISGVAKRLASRKAPKHSPYAGFGEQAIMTSAETVPEDTRRALRRIFRDFLG